MSSILSLRLASKVAQALPKSAAQVNPPHPVNTQHSAPPHRKKFQLEKNCRQCATTHTHTLWCGKKTVCRKRLECE